MEFIEGKFLNQYSKNMIAIKRHDNERLDITQKFVLLN